MKNKLNLFLVGGVITIFAFGFAAFTNTGKAAEKDMLSQHQFMMQGNQIEMMKNSEMQKQCLEMMNQPEMQENMQQMMKSMSQVPQK